MEDQNGSQIRDVENLLLDVAAMRNADQRTISAGCTGIQLMERAGAGVAKAVRQMIGPPARILVVCGPGNNGGDGFVAARLLHESGYQVQLALFGNKKALKGDAAIAATRWPGDCLGLSEIDLTQADLIIDALFGAGLCRAIEGEAKDLIERINQSECPVVAIDIPSGVSGDDGQIAGYAIRATLTVTFATRKPGHLLHPGASMAGRVIVVDIGIKDDIIRAVHDGLFANGPSLWKADFPRLCFDTHKYKRGHVLVLSGGAVSGGASRLAARGALRSGAGLVTIAAPPEALPIHAAHLNAIMLRRMDGISDLRKMLADSRLNSVVLGPALGVGAKTRKLVEVALSSGRAVVIDADAISSFAGHIEQLSRLTKLAPTIITPHDGEYCKLFDKAACCSERKSRCGASIGCPCLERGD